MRGIRTKLGLAVVAVGAVGVMIGAGPAGAAAGGGAVVGHGTISPGLTTKPTFQKITFTGTLAAVGTKNSGTYACIFNGASVIGETLQKGKGNATGTCSGSKGTATANVNYGRTGGEVTLKGTASGALAGALTGACNFAPTSAPQVKSYQLQCAIALH